MIESWTKAKSKPVVLEKAVVCLGFLSPRWFSGDWQRSHWHPKYRTRQKRPSPWWFPASCWWCQLAKAFSPCRHWMKEWSQVDRGPYCIWLDQLWSAVDRLRTYVHWRIITERQNRWHWEEVLLEHRSVLFLFDLTYSMKKYLQKNEEPGRPQSWSRVADRI